MKNWQLNLVWWRRSWCWCNQPPWTLLSATTQTWVVTRSGRRAVSGPSTTSCTTTKWSAFSSSPARQPGNNSDYIMLMWWLMLTCIFFLYLCVYVKLCIMVILYSVYNKCYITQTFLCGYFGDIAILQVMYVPSPRHSPEFVLKRQTNVLN